MGFPQVHRVNTCPDLVGPVGFEPTSKGLLGVHKVFELVVNVSECVSFLQFIKVF